MIAGGAALSGAVTLPIVGLGKAALDMATTLQTAELGFTTMLGSSRAAGEHLEQLKSFAATTPFEFVDLVKASQRMQALGFAAEEVIPNLTAIGNAAAGMGGSADLINRLTLALGQMRAKGKVSGEEMRQLAEAGIPAWEILAKAAGKSIQETMEMGRKGMLQAETAIPALIAGIQGKFGGLMESFSSTVMGRLSNLKDEIGFIMGDIGQSLLPILNEILEKVVIPMVGHLKDLAAAFADLSMPIKGVIIAAAALAASIGPLLVALGGLGLALSGLAPLLGVGAGAGIAGTLGALASLLPPVAAAVAAVAAAFALWQLEPVRDAVKRVGDALAEFWNDILKPGIRLTEEVGKAFFTVAGQIASTGLNTVIDVIRTAVENWRRALDQLFSRFSGWIGDTESLRESLVRIGSFVAATLIGAFKLYGEQVVRTIQFIGELVQAVTNLSASIAGQLLSNFLRFIDVVKGVGTWLGDVLQPVIDVVRDALKRMGLEVENLPLAMLATSVGVVTEAFNLWWDVTKSIIGIIAELVGDSFGSMIRVMGVVADFLWNRIEPGFSAMLRVMKVVGSFIADQLVGSFASMMRVILEFLDITASIPIVGDRLKGVREAIENVRERANALQAQVTGLNAVTDSQAMSLSELAEAAGEARAEYDAVLQKFREGKATTTELADAQRTLTDANAALQEKIRESGLSLDAAKEAAQRASAAYETAKTAFTEVSAAFENGKASVEDMEKAQQALTETSAGLQEAQEALKLATDLFGEQAEETGGQLNTLGGATDAAAASAKVAQVEWIKYMQAVAKADLTSLTTQHRQAAEAVRTLRTQVEAGTADFDQLEKAEAELSRVSMELHEAQVRLDTATGALALSQSTAKTASKDFAKAVTDLGKAADEAQNEVVTLVDTLARIEGIKRAEEAYKKAEERLAKLEEAAENVRDGLVKLEPVIVSMPADIQDAWKDVPDIFGQVEQAIDDAGREMRELDKVFEQAGVQNPAVLQRIADEAEAAYERIRDEGLATGTVLLEAERNSLEARIEANRAAGIEITKEQQKQLERLEDQLGRSTDKQKTIWERYGNQVSTIINDFGKQMSKTIVGLFFGGDEERERLRERKAEVTKSLGEKKRLSTRLIVMI
jgi:tape measure domain-containing protein